MINERDYVELGLGCADICRALDRGMNGRRLDDLGRSVREAIDQLTMWVKLVVCGLVGLLTMLLIAELWGRFEGRSSTRAGGVYSLAFFARRMIRK